MPSKYVIIFILIIFVFIIFFPNPCSSMNNETVTYSIIGLPIGDYGFSSAIIVGLLAFITSIYSTDKQFKITKLSSMPEKASNLLVDLEVIFNNYEFDQKNKCADEIATFLNILELWKEHQTIFRLLTPNFYINFQKVLTYSTKGYNEKDTIPESNKDFITYHILDSIMKVGLNNKNKLFKYKKSDLCKDDEDIFTIVEECEFVMTKKSFLNYISQINGNDTKKLTNEWFLDFTKKIKGILNDLNYEIHQYD